MKNKIPGKVYTASVSRIKELAEFCAEIWLITRAGKDIAGTIRVRGLSPGPALYQDYLEKWKDVDPERWWPQYQARFKEELKQPEKRAALHRLWLLLREGKNVALVCFCPDYRYCHRTIVGDLLREKGVAVEEMSPLADRKERKSGEIFIQEAFNFGL